MPGEALRGGLPWACQRGRLGYIRRSWCVQELHHSKPSHSPINLPLHMIWAQLSLVVTVIFFEVAGRTKLLVLRCVPASRGWIPPSKSSVRCLVAPLSSKCRTTAALAARGSCSWTTITRCERRSSVRS